MRHIPDDKRQQPQPDPFVDDDWNSIDVPADGATVEVWTSDARGPYVIPFSVTFTRDRWLNTLTGEELAVRVEGWRPRRNGRRA
jgi:hypothetical protein